MFANVHDVYVGYVVLLFYIKSMHMKLEMFSDTYERHVFVEDQKPGLYVAVLTLPKQNRYPNSGSNQAVDAELRRTAHMCADYVRSRIMHHTLDILDDDIRAICDDTENLINKKCHENTGATMICYVEFGESATVKDALLFGVGDLCAAVWSSTYSAVYRYEETHTFENQFERSRVSQMIAGGITEVPDDLSQVLTRVFGLKQAKETYGNMYLLHRPWIARFVVFGPRVWVSKDDTKSAPNTTNVMLYTNAVRKVNLTHLLLGKYSISLKDAVKTMLNSARGEKECRCVILVSGGE